MQGNTYISNIDNNQILAPEERANDSNQANDSKHQHGDILKTRMVIQIHNNEWHKRTCHCSPYMFNVMMKYKTRQFND